MAMYSLLRSQGYDPAHALAEFIDNAIQAYLSHCNDRHKHGKPLSVTLRMYAADYPGNPELRNSIQIEDDGPGIDRARLPHALKPARSVGGQGGLSEFGIGMKAAAVWFSDTWSLQTRPQLGKDRFDFTFDLNELLRSGLDTLAVQDSKRSNGQSSGTLITLRQVRHVFDQNKFDGICAALSELYQFFTSGSMPHMVLNAEFNGTRRSLVFDPPARDVLEAPIYRLVGKQPYAIGDDRVWDVPIDMVFQGANITGHICLLATGSYKTNPGLVLFRNDRVIQGTSQRPNTPSQFFGTTNKFSRQRVFGELHMDGVPVTYTKDGFVMNEAAFYAQLKSDPHVAELLRQAESYRTGRTTDLITVKDEAEFLEKTGRKSSSKPPKVPPSDAPPANAPSPPAAAPGARAPAPPSSDAPGSVPVPPKPAVPKKATPYRDLLSELIPKTSLMMQRTVLEEALYQHQWRRYLASALFLRVVLELGVLHRLERDFPKVYPKVSELGIKKVINYLHTNSNQVFDPKNDHRVIRCVQSNAGGQQMDIVLLNNMSHGSYIPTATELDKIAVALEPLLRWAYA